MSDETRTPTDAARAEAYTVKYDDESGYETLLRPDGSELATLTEPEDRNFGRDLSPVLAELSTLRAELDARTAQVGELEHHLTKVTHSCCDCCCEYHPGDMMMVCPKCAEARDRMAKVVDAAERWREAPQRQAEDALEAAIDAYRAKESQ